MKLAVCLSGQPRMFKSSHPSFKQHILDKYDCDIFIFTWENKIGQIERNASFRYKDEGTIGEYISLYRPKSSEVKNYTKEIEEYLVGKEKEYGVIREDNYVRRYLAMLYGIFKANELARQYSESFKIKYDYMLRCRPDAEYSSFELLEKNLVIDHYGNGRYEDAPGDVFAYGKPEAMDEYADLHNCINKYVKEEKILLNTEILLEHHLKKRRIEYGICRHVANIYRPKDF